MDDSPGRGVKPTIKLDSDTGLEVQVTVRRIPSTAQTRERHAFLKTKRMGDSWEEGGALYRKGPVGNTVFRVSAQTRAADRRDEELTRMAETLMSQIRQWNQNKPE